MKVAVWDTYITKKDGTIMHFDIIVPESLKNREIIVRFIKEYLATKGQEGQPINTKDCSFCHLEIIPESKEQLIKQKGYYIIEMEGCNS